MEKKKGMIYKIEVDGELLYIGSTTNMRSRKNGHKTKCFNQSDRAYNKPLYQTIRSKGITKDTFKERFKMLWVCNIEFHKRYELKAAEAKFIKELEPVCNCLIPYSKEWNQKQYYQDNKESIKEYNKRYYQDNTEYHKQYYQDNIDKIKQYNKQYMKQYRNDNKYKIREQKKQYYLDNKDKIKQRNKQYRNDNKQYYKEYKQQHRKDNKEYHKQYRKSDKSKKICLFCKQKYSKSPKHFYIHTKSNKHKKNCITFIDDVRDTIDSILIHI